VIVDTPETRIVSDELWNQVQEQRRIQHEKYPIAKLGGIERVKHDYLFSGLLFCGDCGGSIAIVRPKTYGCVNHRQRGNCANRTGIRADRLEDQLIRAIAQKITEPSMLAHLQQQFEKSLHQEAKRVSATKRSIRSAKNEINSELKKPAT
jgi:site-specific DNA recombinase